LWQDHDALRMIAGFETPTEGAIRLHGEDVSRVRPYKRNVNIAVWITERRRIPPQIDVISTMILVVGAAVAVSAVPVGGRRARKRGQA